MKVNPFFICLVPLLFLSAPIVFASTESAVNVYAAYNSSPIDSASDSTTSLVIPAEAHALAEYQAGGHYAQADAEATLDDTLNIAKLFTFAEGFDSYGSSLEATASAISSADWLIYSDTLPVGTPVQVWMDMEFQGQLYSQHGDYVSSAETSLLLDGTEIYSGSASFGRPDLTVTGDWISNVFANGSFAYDVYALGAPPPIDTAVGETINLTIYLQAAIVCMNTLEGGARADFSNSAFYRLQNAFEPGSSSPADIDFVLVPEPTAILLLAAGSLILRKRI